jgi:hypothetical protein
MPVQNPKAIQDLFPNNHSRDVWKSQKQVKSCLDVSYCFADAASEESAALS